jgi:hypothetical protein
VSTNHRDVAEAFRVTLDLVETGVALMRHNLRRSDPSATEKEIDQRLAAWLHHRPGVVSSDLTDYSHRCPKGNRQMRRVLNQAANAAVKARALVREAASTLTCS